MLVFELNATEKNQSNTNHKDKTTGTSTTIHAWIEAINDTIRPIFLLYFLEVLFNFPLFNPVENLEI